MEQILLIFLFSTPLILILFISLKSLTKSSNLPPGRMGWPFLGETLEFVSTGRNGIQAKFFKDRMNQHSPEVFKTSLISEKMAVFCGAAGNKFLFSNENKLVTSWWPRNVEKIFSTSVHGPSGVEAMKVRKLLPGFVKPDSLQKYVGTVDAIAKEHLDAIGDETKVHPLAIHYTFAVACRLLLSIDDPATVATFEKPFQAVLGGIFSLPINLPGTTFRKAIRAAESIRSELLKIIRLRKSEGDRRHGDILDHMLATTDEVGRFTAESEIANQLIGLLIGGYDTASNVITAVMKYLAEYPEVYDNVLKEQREIAANGELLRWEDLQKMKYSWNVACEAMRLSPPLQGTFRVAIADFTYAGFSIPKGWKLYWNVNTTHMNPDYFKEPEKFDPTRFEGNGPVPYSFVPFGGGPRMCPGKDYARFEILVFMHNIVRKFKWEKVIPDEKIIADPISRPAYGLPVRMRRHL